ncbi:uncharacterized protein [Parasteatoda tepidariorum]|uniref:uncharacterized protein n=1 Tax=Parasteatoda tepidariorum TaxID=114398 RepID=UPI00077F82B4|nr:uncharacterized protein LOC107454566 [Parasteatoda tepidariorum]
MASTSTAKALVKNRLSRTRHGSTKSSNSHTFRRPPSPDSACEHDAEWVMGTVSGPEDMTSDLSEEGDKSCGRDIRNVSAIDATTERSTSENSTSKNAAGQDRQDSDVDSGIVACRKVGERIGSTSSADTDSSQESRPRKEYTPTPHKNELTKSRSYTGSLRVPRRCQSSSGPVKGDHLALKECNRRPPTPLSVFPDSHHCVRFDEQLQLSEQNIRRSCRKLFATLYAQRFSYPSHQDPSSLHGRSNSVHSRIRSRTVPELDLRQYAPMPADIQVKNARNHTIPEVYQEEARPPSSAWSRRAVQKSMSDASIGERGLGTSPVQRYKSKCNYFPMDLPEDKVCHTASTDSGLGSLRNSGQCTCHSHQTAVIPSSQPSNVSTCTCRCCSCNQELSTNVNNASKLFKSSSCSTLSSTLSHQSRPHLTQFPPRTLRKVMSHSEDKPKIKYLQKTSSCSNLLDRPSSGYHIANVPVYNDNMVQAYAHLASVIPEDLKSSCSSHGGRRAKTLNRLRYTTDNVFTEPYRPHSSFSSTSEPPHCSGKRDYAEQIPFQTSSDKDVFNNRNNPSISSFNNAVGTTEADTKSIVSAEIYSQINDDDVSSSEKTSHRESLKHRTFCSERPKSIGVVIPNRGPNPVYLKSALKKPTQSAIINVNDLTDLETQVKGIAPKPSEVEYAMVDKTKKNRFASLPVLNGSSNIITNENEEKDPPVPPKKNLHKSDFSLYRSRSSSPKKTILERMQTLTKNAKSALQKAFSTERIYRPEREERMEGQKGLQRSKSFIRGLTSSFRKKKRKNRGSPTAEVVPQTGSNSEWNDQTNSQNTQLNVLGQLLQLNLDGSQVVELTKPPTKPYGFFVARGRVRNSKGVFVSRMRDQETQKQLAGLLDIGDEILEIDGFNVKDADIMEVNRLMSNKNTMLLTVLPYICRKDI